MAKELTNNQNVDPLLIASMAGGNLNPAIQKLLEKYLERSIERLEITQIKEEQDNEILKKQLYQKTLAQARNAEIAEQARLKDEAKQANCGHALRNPLGFLKSIVGGQRTGLGMWTFRCQACGKQWKDKVSVPPHLLPKNDQIGGMVF